jgi:hypothetical protein
MAGQALGASNVRQVPAAQQSASQLRKSAMEYQYAPNGTGNAVSWYEVQVRRYPRPSLNFTQPSNLSSKNSLRNAPQGKQPSCFFPIHTPDDLSNHFKLESLILIRGYETPRAHNLILWIYFALPCLFSLVRSSKD